MAPSSMRGPSRRHGGDSGRTATWRARCRRQHRYCACPAILEITAGVTPFRTTSVSAKFTIVGVRSADTIGATSRGLRPCGFRRSAEGKEMGRGMSSIARRHQPAQYLSHNSCGFFDGAMLHFHCCRSIGWKRVLRREVEPRHRA